MGGTDTDVTLRAARISAWVSAAGATIAAGALLLNTYWGQRFTEQSEREKRELQVLLFATNASSQTAYCNLQLWTNAGMVRHEWADPTLKALKEQRGVTDKCNI
jgi:hypothetical protein